MSGATKQGGTTGRRKDPETGQQRQNMEWQQQQRQEKSEYESKEGGGGEGGSGGEGRYHQSRHARPLRLRRGAALWTLTFKLFLFNIPVFIVA